MTEYKKIANHLLDLGKRNRLLNYKEIGLRSINILNNDINTVFHDIVESKEYTIILIDSILEKQRNITLDSEDNDILSYSPYKVLDIINPILKPKQLICYKRGHLQAKVLKALHKEYNFSLNEKGLNSLYLAFGFISYVEENITYKAPILLIPVEYKKEVSSYKIKEYDDEVILNPTLEYYFKQQYKITLPQYNDESLEEYLEKIKKVLIDKMNIINEAAIGIFSFQKMNMYNDLTTNEEEILTNNNINSLLGNQILGYQSYPNDKEYPVVNCDSSQLAAIKLAVEGQSFVLQGPPGSGKSQTITNIISSLIANNRKVLFVSEKLAALQVVYENLRRVGLNDFALEIHSSKANKKDFIDNIYKTAILPRYNIESKTEDDLLSHEATKAYLDDYINEIHKVIPNEKYTLFELISEYTNIDLEALKYKIINISKYSLIDLKKIQDLLLEYSILIKPLGYNYKDLAFNGLLDTSLNYIDFEIENDLVNSIKYLTKLEELRNKISDNIKINNKEVLSINDLYYSFDFISNINQVNYFNTKYFNKDERDKLSNALDTYNDLINKLPDISMYNKDILELDLKDSYWYFKGCTSFFTKLFDKKYKQIKRTLLAYRNEKAKHNVILEELNNLLDYKDKTAKINECLNIITEFYDDDNIDKNKIKIDLELTSKFIDDYINYDNINMLLDVLLRYKNYQSEDIIYNKLASNFDNTIIDFYNSALLLIKGKLSDIYLLKDKLRNYSNLKVVLDKIEYNNQKEFLDYYLSLGLELDDLPNAFKKVYLKNKILEQFDKSPLLKAFNSDQFELKINEFKELDEKILSINRDFIISKISKKRPEDILSVNSPFGILTHEYNKVKRKKPIRVLLDEILTFVLDIKPIFLMSPLSVSTYLTSESGLFDCVIFDEASQIFAWDALGSIYRAKQCIIIGDSKQMPPTNFFNASLDTEEIEDDYEELDSILDMASTSLKTASLRWHYRSRSEELIAFSNKSFYDNNLITIPQAKAHVKGFGIDFVYIENGIYEMKSRTNLVEAERICDMVIEHYQQSSQSLGVVAFSKVQAELIEELIEKKISQYPEILKYFTNEVDEPFFVKNLETVQGDERDRIIFSICYGYNSDNKFYQRFGPLNNVGGERRLNVAITRAKYNITVVSSIRYTDIKPSESLGSKLLKEYLEFCENVETKKNSEDSTNGIVLSIKSFLEDNGYSVLTNYGASSFKIPVAVKSKDNNNFLAAIMIDNNKDNTNTTDINRLEELLLNRLGWKYYKIFSPAWFNSTEREKEKLLNFLNSKLEIEAEEEEETFLEVAQKTDFKDKFDKYVDLSIEELKSDYDKYDIEYVINKIIKTEYPISLNYLMRKISKILDKKSITNVVKNLTLQNLPADIIKRNDFIWIKYKEYINLRIDSDRTIDEIPQEELKDGIIKILNESISMPRKDCYKALIEILGYSKLTESSKKRLDDAVIFLQLDGKIIVNNDILSL